MKGPVPIGFDLKSSAYKSIISFGTTEQYFIVSIPKKALNGFFKLISKIESLIALKLSTFSNTHAPGAAIFGLINLLKLYSKS